MKNITLRKWLQIFTDKFSQRELDHMIAYRAVVNIQLLDKETEELHTHELEYISKSALDLSVKEKKNG